MFKRPEWLRGREGSLVLMFAMGIAAALACSASGSDSPYGGSGGASTGGVGGSGAVADADVDAVGDSQAGAAGTSGQSGSGGASGGGTGGVSGTGGTGGIDDAGGPGGWPNCVALQLPTTPPTPVDVIMSGTPSDAATKFGGAVDPSRAPTLIYPPDGTLMPPNIATLDVQFLPGTGNDLFEVSFESSAVSLHVYTSCNAVSNGCSVKVDGALWTDEIAKKAAGLDNLEVRVRGVASSSPSSVGESESREIGVAEELMLGGIYYWDASGSIVRYDFGFPTAQGEQYYNQFQAGAMCVGCHTVSPPGNLIAAGLNIPGPSVLRVLDVGTKTQRFQLNGFDGSNFQAFSPDENEIITSNGSNLIWRNSLNGQAANPNPLIAKGTMPDYHPDMTMIVFARPGGLALFANPGITNGSLYLLHRNGLTWGSEQLLLQASNGDENNYYPAFSPDGSFVLFNRSADHDSYLAPNSMVWMIPTAGGAPIDLARANLNEEVGNSWPKWAPYKQCNRGKRILWYTVSSARDYGLRIQNPPLPSDPDAGDPRRWQLWMAAVDLDAAEAGQDPSFPAFWLPFQDMGTGNHIAQWVEKVVRRPCLNDTDCPATHRCEANECVPK